MVAYWLAEGMGEPELCSQGFALEFEEVAATASEELMDLSRTARDGLELWADAKETPELRTVLLAMAERAREDARAWRALAEQFAALGREGPHIHVDDDGRERAADHHDVIDIASSDIRY